ncbi:hypothetical protein A2U01_0061672, partial [Trifolium medium]|nr:hypothetical protein [Trifolium medium]
MDESNHDMVNMLTQHLMPNQQIRSIQNQTLVQNQPVPNNPGVPLIQGQQ